MAAADILVSFLLLVAIYSILSFGLNIKFGHAGLLDFGHVAFFLVGAYAAALVVIPPDTPGDFTRYVIGLGDVPVVGTWLIAVMVAAVVAGVIGGLVALPTIRLREDYLAITLLGVSVIFQRVVQSESWLANGPDALRGYSPPLQDLFPLEMGLVSDVIVVGLVVFVVWSVLTTAVLIQTRRSQGGSLVALARLGALRLDRPGFPGGRATRALVAGGVVALASVGLLLVTGSLLIIGLVVSTYGWTALAVELRQRYGGLPRRTLAGGVALGTGLLVALLPLPLAGSLSLQVLGTLGLLAGLIGAYYYGLQRAAWVREAKLTLVAIGGLWFVGIWYVLLPVLGPLGDGDLGGVVATLFANVVWFLQFGGDVGVSYAIAFVGDVTVKLGYARFQLALFVAVMLAAYVVIESTVNSPFGRVLRAIRNDEAVVESLGKNPFVYKTQAMIIGSALAGVAGALWAMYSQGLTFRTGEPRITFIALLIVFIGGLGNNRGMVLGAAVFWAFQQATSQLAGYFPTGLRENVLAFRLVVIGVLFLVILYYRPEGLLGRGRYKTDTEVDSS